MLSVQAYFVVRLCLCFCTSLHNQERVVGEPHAISREYCGRVIGVTSETCPRTFESGNVIYFLFQQWRWYASYIMYTTLVKLTLRRSYIQQYATRQKWKHSSRKAATQSGHDRSQQVISALWQPQLWRRRVSRSCDQQQLRRANRSDQL